MATSIENQAPPEVAPPGVPLGPQGSPGQGAHVLLKDVGHLVRLNAVAVPSGFSKLGNPLLYFPQDPENHFLSVAESDLHLLFKYYLAVVPRAEQAQGKWKKYLKKLGGLDEVS